MEDAQAYPTHDSDLLASYATIPQPNHCPKALLISSLFNTAADLDPKSPKPKDLQKHESRHQKVRN